MLQDSCLYRCSEYTNTDAYIKEMPALDATCSSKELKIKNTHSFDENRNFN